MKGTQEAADCPEVAEIALENSSRSHAQGGNVRSLPRIPARDRPHLHLDEAVGAHLILPHDAIKGCALLLCQSIRHSEDSWS